jgi:hypothetical protein
MKEHEVTQRIVFVFIPKNKHTKHDFWQLGWINGNNNYVRTEWYETFREALQVAKCYPHAELFVKTQDEYYPLDCDSQEMMDLLRY